MEYRNVIAELGEVLNNPTKIKGVKNHRKTEQTINVNQRFQNCLLELTHKGIVAYDLTFFVGLFADRNKRRYDRLYHYIKNTDLKKVWDSGSYRNTSYLTKPYETDTCISVKQVEAKSDLKPKTCTKPKTYSVLTLKVCGQLVETCLLCGNLPFRCVCADVENCFFL